MHTITDSLCISTKCAPITPSGSNLKVDMSTVCSIILSGGQGTRLFPLTQIRCKPAIIFGGRYRLIDVAISNSLNSNIRKNFIITQFLASSLHQYIYQTYRTDSFSSGFIEVLGVEEKPNCASWFQGTADAVRQNLEYLAQTPADFFLILSGDQLYHLDFQQMLCYAMEKEVDLVVATQAVSEKEACRMGIMKVNEDHHIIDFYEKPQQATILDRFATPPSVLEKMGLPANTKKHFLGSMGIYLFRRSALFDLLIQNAGHDFGKHLIPAKVKIGSIASFPYNGYWEDIGTIESFYKANLALTHKEPPFSLYSEANPILTRYHNLPGAKISNTYIKNSILCEGALIDADEISGSVIGQRSIIGQGSIVRDSYLMGNDQYTSPVAGCQGNRQQYGVDRDCIIQTAIIDKNVCLGKGVQLINKNKLKEYDSPHGYIRDGIIVIPSGTSLPDGFVL
jgi:glucose-1-phosphate adenylyltransferase